MTKRTRKRRRELSNNEEWMERETKGEQKQRRREVRKGEIIRPAPEKDKEGDQTVIKVKGKML